MQLNSLMSDQNKGLTYVSHSIKFHGKAYSFCKEKKPFASIVGSTNISILGDQDKRQFEIDVLLQDGNSINKIYKLQNELIQFSKTIDEIDNIKIIENKKLDFLEPYTRSESISVSKLDIDLKNKLLSNATNFSFKIPLKCEEKSSMNVAFGKGRENTSNKIIIPRSWFEFEIIVGVDITTKKGYPVHTEFWIVTEDGWKFKAKTQGGNSKNLRSMGDLKVLGAWVKGHLLNAGLVRYGQFISQSDLDKCGKTHLNLTKLNSKIDGLDVYYLEFFK
jgi:hypothetical protein